jgi:hypothetical protein
MSLSPSRALANALRSTLWIVSYYTSMNGTGPTLRDLKIAIGRAIVELETEATTEVSIDGLFASRSQSCTPTR